MTACPRARRRCRRAGRTTPIPTPTSTRRAASTRRRCRSTRSGRDVCIPTGRSTSRTATISACPGSRATAGPISRTTTIRRASLSGTSRTSSGSPSTTSPATGSRTTCTRCGRRSTERPATARSAWRCRATGARRSPRRSRSPRRHHDTGDHVRVSVGRQRRHAVRGVRRWLRHRRQEPRRACLRRPLDRRRGHVRPVRRAVSPGENPDGFLPNTRFRDGIIENFAASPTYPGHLYLTYEDWDAAHGQFDVKLTQSTDGGLTWTPALRSTTNAASTDQFQPSVAAGPAGAVAVAFYDRRATCPSDPSILPAHRGRPTRRIDISLQPYKDTGTAAGAVPVGGNVRISQFTWDPDQPQQKVGGLTQYPCAGDTDPCATGRGFIGDYFGVAVSGANIYTFGVSTHYPSPP